MQKNDVPARKVSKERGVETQKKCEVFAVNTQPMREERHYAYRKQGMDIKYWFDDSTCAMLLPCWHSIYDISFLRLILLVVF